MTDPQLADLSRTLFSPVTLVLYTIAMLAYFYALAFTKVDRDDGDTAVAGRRATRIATVLAVAGLAAHLAHIGVRTTAMGRFPLGNMFEFSSVIALTAVVAGLAVFQWRMRRPEVMGFVLLGALVTLGISLLLYAEPGPLNPILDTSWLMIHVSAISIAAGIFTLGFVFNALHLFRDSAERGVAAAQTAALTGSTVGAAYAGGSTTASDGEILAVEDRLDEVGPDDLARGGVRAPAEDDDRKAYGKALRAAVAQTVTIGGRRISFPFRTAAIAVTAAVVFSLVFEQASTTAAMAVLTLAVVAGSWWALPYLPTASTLDSLAYRTIAFGFPIWTAAVILGAIWAEQSWGRFGGWDPKETSAFVTWVAYAAYLHARATRGFRGRTASWVGVLGFAALLFTYYVVNLLITGLHSYAGL
jgi:ABC-type transport system involved in cytochrome c biogenesis permease subunit